MHGCQVLGVEGHKAAAKLTDVPTVVWNMELGPLMLANIDLTFSIEFVEHVSNEKAVIDTLTNGKMIVMSAAQPGQGGHNHVNCQTEEHWQKLITNRGYRYLEELSLLVRTWDSSYFSSTGMIFIREDVDYGTFMGSYKEKGKEDYQTPSRPEIEA
jgi:hypothetical protein